MYLEHSLSLDCWPDLIKDVTCEEVHLALFSMGDDKAPGPDGFTIKFFRQVWGVVGPDFTSSAYNFFQLGQLLGEVNATIISLIPKVPHPEYPSQFRPISYCSVIYKVISNILANHLKPLLPHLVDGTQTTFVPGRSIGANILLAQELLHCYHLPRGPPRYALKVDLNKAYDFVNWEFLLLVLWLRKFPLRFC